MDIDQSETLSNFLAITGGDEAQGLSLLQACDWRLQDAVDLFFASNEAPGPQGSAPIPSKVGKMPLPLDEEGVRAPLPAKVERLYDPRHGHASSMPYGVAQQQSKDTQHVDVFREFKSASPLHGGELGGAGSSNSLSLLFKPPEELLFGGTFDLAKMRAQQDGKWLLLNIQSSSEFDSHRLNRDTWSHESLKEMIKGMFLFVQRDNRTPEGQSLCTMYNVFDLPSILLVDPVTGAKILDRSGFVGPEQLIEDLIPFLDHGPNDPGALQLRQTMGHKRKAVEKVVKPVTADTQVTPTALTEDEQVAMAIAMSLQNKEGVESHHRSHEDSKDGVKGLLDDLEDLDEEEVYAQIRQMEEQQKQQEVLRQQQEEQQRNKRDPAQVQKEAEQRLPEEPPPSASSTCRVAIRLPDGSRLQRCFDRNSHTVQALHDWCVSRLPEAAGGRPYQLVSAAPGAQQALEDQTQTLEVAGVANAMLAVKWLD